MTKPNTRRIGAWLPPALIKAIDRHAIAAGLSRSAMVHRALDVMFKTKAARAAMVPGKKEAAE